MNDTIAAKTADPAPRLAAFLFRAGALEKVMRIAGVAGLTDTSNVRK